MPSSPHISTNHMSHWPRTSPRTMPSRGNMTQNSAAIVWSRRPNLGFPLDRKGRGELQIDQWRSHVIAGLSSDSTGILQVNTLGSHRCTRYNQEKTTHAYMSSDMDNWAGPNSETKQRSISNFPFLTILVDSYLVYLYPLTGSPLTSSLLFHLCVIQYNRSPNSSLNRKYWSNRCWV
jgi:hypothetical protein